VPACNFTRRDFLRWTASAAAAGAIADLGLEPSYAAKAGSIVPVNLELVTLAEDHAVITWYTGAAGTDDGTGRMVPAPAEGVVHYGTHPGRLNKVAHGIGGKTPYHHVELTGLEPGQTYYYQARSNGKKAQPTVMTLAGGNAVGTSDYRVARGGPYAFTTPHAPHGSHLFNIVLCNDLHLGETVAGLVSGLGAGISQAPGLPPYPEVMLRSLLHDVKRFKPRYLLAAGDLSSEAEPVDLSRAGQMLSTFGTYKKDYFVTRGNHDRAHEGDAYADCRVGEWQGNDCFQDAYFPKDEVTYFSRDLSGLHVVGLDTYDKAGDGGDAGGLSAAQMDWFEADLAAHKDQPTVVFGHHPLTVEKSAFPASAGEALDPAQASTILDWYAKTPGVFLHHAGHTHRNHRTIYDQAPKVTHMEVAAAKEYPGGYSVLRLHTGGYALNFYKATSEHAREWNERTRQEISGLWPQFAFGNTVSDRNAVVRADLSGLKR